jgi:hypothetical protein
LEEKIKRVKKSGEEKEIQEKIGIYIHFRENLKDFLYSENSADFLNSNFCWHDFLCQLVAFKLGVIQVKKNRLVLFVAIFFLCGVISVFADNHTATLNVTSPLEWTSYGGHGEGVLSGWVMSAWFKFALPSAPSGTHLADANLYMIYDHDYSSHLNNTNSTYIYFCNASNQSWVNPSPSCSDYIYCDNRNIPWDSYGTVYRWNLTSGVLKAYSESLGNMSYYLDLTPFGGGGNYYVFGLPYVILNYDANIVYVTVTVNVSRFVNPYTVIMDNVTSDVIYNGYDTTINLALNQFHVYGVNITGAQIYPFLGFVNATANDTLTATPRSSLTGTGSLMTDVGSGVGNMISGFSMALFQYLVYIAVIMGALSIFYAIAYVFKKFTGGNEE